MSALSTTIGWSGSYVRSMSVIGTAPVFVERGRRVEAGHLGDDLLAGAEAVVAVPLVGADRVAGDVARHRERVQVEAPAGVGGRVGDREVVVRPRLQADGRVERVAPLLAGRGRRGRGQERDRASRSVPGTATTGCEPRSLPLDLRTDARLFLPATAPNSTLPSGGRALSASASFRPWKASTGTAAPSFAARRSSARSRAGTTPPSPPRRRCRSCPRSGAPSGWARSTRRSSTTSRSRGPPSG